MLYYICCFIHLLYIYTLVGFSQMGFIPFLRYYLRSTPKGNDSSNSRHLGKSILLFLFTCSFIYLVVLIYLYMCIMLYCFIYLLNIYMLVDFYQMSFIPFPRHYVRSTAREKDSSSLGIQEKQYCCFYLFVYISIYLIVHLSCSSIYFVVSIYLVALFTCLFILLHLFTCSSIYIVHSFCLLIVIYIASFLSLSLSLSLSLLKSNKHFLPLFLLVTFSLERVTTTSIINLYISNQMVCNGLGQVCDHSSQKIKLYHRWVFLKWVLNLISKYNIGMLPRKW